ncbi:MAG: sulfotransferase domain-containing protein [Acidimicrobiia bacterium]
MGSIVRAIAQATAPLRDLPDFLIIGGIRCGTSSMSNYLSTHPDAGIPQARKEVHYFDRSHARGPNWYRSWFPLRFPRGKICGEASPTYLMDPVVPQRVAGLLPSVKLVVLLRDPVERAASHYSLRRARGAEPESTLAAALEDEEQRLLGKSHHPGVTGLIDCYFEQGSYIKGLRRWLAYFDRDSFLVVNCADFFKDPANVYDQTLSFLGLSPHRPDFVVHNSTPRLAVEDETLVRLRERYRPLNAELETEFGIRFQ